MTTELNFIEVALVVELKQAFNAWMDLPEGLTDEEAGDTYKRWELAYERASRALPKWQVRKILQECVKEF